MEEIFNEYIDAIMPVYIDKKQLWENSKDKLGLLILDIKEEVQNMKREYPDEKDIYSFIKDTWDALEVIKFEIYDISAPLEGLLASVYGGWWDIYFETKLPGISKKFAFAILDKLQSESE